MRASAPMDFPDASKLTSNAADLTWSAQDLYGLLFQHLGNADISTAERFREHTGHWRSTVDRFAPPERLVGDAEAQADAFIEIAGPYMGTNHRKGHSYPWLPNHLAEGNGQASPRTFLVALRSQPRRPRGRTQDIHELCIGTPAGRTAGFPDSRCRVARRPAVGGQWFNLGRKNGVPRVRT
jgi:hypothetical protein